MGCGILYRMVAEQIGLCATLAMRRTDVHSVVEDAVEQNSWGKSGSDWMCRFQNNRGLHRTSGDAPPETHDIGERAGIHSILTNHFVC